MPGPVSGLVLAAGGSRRLGTPKQLLPHRDATLPGDQAMWTLLDRRPGDVADVRISGVVPHDVDTREDYEALLAAERAGAR